MYEVVTADSRDYLMRYVMDHRCCRCREQRHAGRRYRHYQNRNQSSHVFAFDMCSGAVWRDDGQHHRDQRRRQRWRGKFQFAEYDLANDRGRM